MLARLKYMEAGQTIVDGHEDQFGTALFVLETVWFAVFTGASVLLILYTLCKI